MTSTMMQSLFHLLISKGVLLVIVVLLMIMILFHIAVAVEKLWYTWVAFKVKRYMRMQGFSGPDTAEEKFMRTMRPLTAKPLDTISHDIEPWIAPPTAAWRKVYGDKFIFSANDSTVLHICDPKAIRELLSCKSEDHCKGRLISCLTEVLGRGGLPLAKGSSWARQRRVVRPAFYGPRSKETVKPMASWIDEWLERLGNLVVSDGGAIDIDMSDLVGDLTKDILARSSFGSNYAKGREGFRSQEKLLKLVIQRGRGVSPVLRYLPSRLNFEIWKAKGEVSKCLREMIQSRRETVQKASCKSYGEDLLGLLLAERDNQHLNSCQERRDKWTDADLIDQCRAFFSAGAETVAAAVLWSIVMLAHYPDWQDRIRAEIGESFQGVPDGDKLAKLKLLDMFVDETTRLYPPAMRLHRQVVVDNATIRGEPLPKALVIRLNILALHRNKEYWGDDALDFRPERFSGGVMKACKDVYAFIPFGAGQRICVAQSLALIEVKLILAMLLRRFSISRSPSYRHQPGHLLSMQPKFGVPVLVKCLNSSDV